MKRGHDASVVLNGLLKARGWTQEEVAEKANIGRSTITGYCTGSRSLGEKNAEKIARALGVEVSLLLPPENVDSFEAVLADLDVLRQRVEALRLRRERREAETTRLLQETQAALAAARERGRHPQELAKPGSRRRADA